MCLKCSNNPLITSLFSCRIADSLQKALYRSNYIIVNDFSNHITCIITRFLSSLFFYKKRVSSRSYTQQQVVSDVSGSSSTTTRDSCLSSRNNGHFSSSHFHVVLRNGLLDNKDNSNVSTLNKHIP